MQGWGSEFLDKSSDRTGILGGLHNGFSSKYGVYDDLTIIYPKPYSIYLKGTIEFQGFRL